MDQNAHMLWGKYETELLEFYKAIDQVVGETMSRIDESTTLEK